MAFNIRRDFRYHPCILPECDPQDALEFIMAGASMVAVGTANFFNPRATLDVIEGIGAYMGENQIEDGV